MRNLLRRLEAIFSASAFAEEGEVETARRILQEAERDERQSPGPTAPALRPVSRGAAVARGSRA